MKAFATLRKRAHFLAAASSGFKFVKHSVIVQSRKRAETEYADTPVRIGFTATKKLGNAVIRNRAKRRLRAAAAALLPTHGREGVDYVFVGREATYKGTFDDLIRDMKHALKRLSEMMP